MNKGSGHTRGSFIRRLSIKTRRAIVSVKVTEHLSCELGLHVEQNHVMPALSGAWSKFMNP